MKYEDKISEVLMTGIDEMYKTLIDIDNENVDLEKAKIKIATNNSMCLSVKTLIQHEILKQQAIYNREKTSQINHLISK